MRARLLVLFASASLIGSGLAIQACSSSDPVVDAADAAEGGIREAGAVDAAEAEAPCDPNNDLLRKVKDASIGDGASTTGVCLGCAKTKCSDAITKCQRDCPCQRIVSDAIECYLTTQQIGCAVDLADYLITPATRKYALEVLGCARTECPQECAVDAGEEPEGGTPSDAAADAPDGD